MFIKALMTMAITSNNTKDPTIPPQPGVTVSRSGAPRSKAPVRTISCPIANKANTAIKAGLENPCKIRVGVNQATPFLSITGKT